MIDSINFNNFSGIEVNNSKNNQSIEHKLINPFQEALRQLKIKMNSLIQSKKNNNTDNIIQKILDNNLYVSSEFKSRRFIKKDISESNSTKKNVSTNNNIKENNLNLSSINSFPKINIQNKIIQNKNYSQNLNEISSHINIPNITNGNNNYNNMILLGKKRNLDDKEESEKESLYKDIKSIYNKYKNDKNNNEENEISMYDVDTGFFEKNETVVIGNPVCIIYFNRKIISSIYLIREKITVFNNNEIIEVLNKLKIELNEHISKKKI
jgi:hypothetical protein